MRQGNRKVSFHYNINENMHFAFDFKWKSQMQTYAWNFLRWIRELSFSVPNFKDSLTIQLGTYNIIFKKKKDNGKRLRNIGSPAPAWPLTTHLQPSLNLPDFFCPSLKVCHNDVNCESDCTQLGQGPLIQWALSGVHFAFTFMPGQVSSQNND